MSTPHKSHKRQKSSVSNPGFYFVNKDQPQLPPTQQQSQQSLPSFSHQQGLPPNEEHDPYPNYNFVAPDMNRSKISASGRLPGDYSHETQQGSPLKRGASSAFDHGSDLPNIATSSSVQPQPSFFYSVSHYHDPSVQSQQSQQNSATNAPTSSSSDQSSTFQPSQYHQPQLPMFGGGGVTALAPALAPSSFAYNTHSQPSMYATIEGSASNNLSSFAHSYTATSSKQYPMPATGFAPPPPPPPPPPHAPSSSLASSSFATAATPQPLGTAPMAASTTTPTTASASASAYNRHQKNNLSISSHLTLFNLNSHPNEPLSEPSLKRTGKESNAVLNDLIFGLTSVDGSNINNFLLSVLYKINLPFPLDDFYNLLYNNDRQRPYVSNFNFHQKLDKTPVSPSSSEISIHIINSLLNTFKNPSSLTDYFPAHDDKESKLNTINYHELLRTFLAIKVLSDMMIQLPLTSDEDPQNYTIPRLSIYKTYYIICQKLIASYPSSSNTASEQQKLILGQSKLGKLIKMVYPNLLIKRLGSRGESKYNYLGVIWNENIINDSMKQLCEENELQDLTEIFSSDNANANSNRPNPFMASLGPPPGDVLSNMSTPRKSHRRLSSKSKIKLGQISESFPDSGDHNGGRGIGGEDNDNDDDDQQQQQQQHQHHHHHHQHHQHHHQKEELQVANPISSPRLSFVKPFLMYPNDQNFTVLAKNERNWFQTLLDNVYSQNPHIDRNLVESILLQNANLKNNFSLLRNLIDSVIKPLSDDRITFDKKNVDLSLYLVIVLEVLPYLLLIKASADINLLKNLRLNLLHVINNLNSELKNVDSSKFPLSNSTIFLISLKKLINLNDLLITFIKLINKKSSKSMMSTDIENFLKINSQTIKLDEDTGDSNHNFFFNLSTTSMGEINFNFKNDILSNDLIYTLIGYNYDPKVNSELKSSISMNFITEEINIIDEFFKNDLLKFLSSSYYDDDYDDDDESGSQVATNLHNIDTQVDSVPQSGDLSQSQLQSQSAGSQKVPGDGSETVLTAGEMAKLNSLIGLIDIKLLSSHFKSKYPILIYNNYIAYILNDILKYIFLKQQQAQLQQQQQQQQQQRASEDSGSESQQPKSSNPLGENSFGNWWVFNSFIQEYMSLMGEIVGLQDCIAQG
ncbi:uncharacterized protein LODBEIA_P50030 [Lodderomyces beijingensis]|uniref:RFX-type winged-helix domain-containing protein n=1 Tax=Lodderomyces beijingensis TaxID=1775926 RepID=A0ABP0ZRM0_9ASCO